MGKGDCIPLSVSQEKKTRSCCKNSIHWKGGNGIEMTSRRKEGGEKRICGGEKRERRDQLATGRDTEPLCPRLGGGKGGAVTGRIVKELSSKHEGGEEKSLGERKGEKGQGGFQEEAKIGGRSTCSRAELFGDFSFEREKKAGRVRNQTRRKGWNPGRRVAILKRGGEGEAHSPGLSGVALKLVDQEERSLNQGGGGGQLSGSGVASFQQLLQER